MGLLVVMGETRDYPPCSNGKGKQIELVNMKANEECRPTQEYYRPFQGLHGATSGVLGKCLISIFVNRH